MEGQTPIYVLTVNGQERKAIDLIALKQFLEEKKMQYSILRIDPSSIGPEEKVITLLAKASAAVLAELEDTIDVSLGIKEPEKEAIEPEVVEEPEVEEQEEPEDEEPEYKEPKQEAQKIPRKDGKIVL